MLHTASDGVGGRRRRDRRPHAHRPGEGRRRGHQGTGPTVARAEGRRDRPGADAGDGADGRRRARAGRLPGEQRGPDVRPAHRHVGAVPGGELHGDRQRVERRGPVPLGAEPRIDRQHLVDGRVPSPAAHVVPPRSRRAASHDRAGGLRPHEVDGDLPDPADGADARRSQHPRQRGVPGGDDVAGDEGGGAGAGDRDPRRARRCSGRRSSPRT